MVHANGSASVVTKSAIGSPFFDPIRSKTIFSAALEVSSAIWESTNSGDGKSSPAGRHCLVAYTSHPNDELKDGCVALYQSEKAQGTEMRAIIGVLQELIDREEERLRLEREQNWRRLKEEERIKLEQRLLSGADCGWTAIAKSDVLYSRRNGRAFRISQGKNKRWTLYRIKDVGDEGNQLGTYQSRREANKALEKIAYAPEQQC